MLSKCHVEESRGCEQMSIESFMLQNLTTVLKTLQLFTQAPSSLSFIALLLAAATNENATATLSSSETHHTQMGPSSEAIALFYILLSAAYALSV